MNDLPVLLITAETELRRHDWGAALLHSFTCSQYQSLTVWPFETTKGTFYAGPVCKLQKRLTIDVGCSWRSCSLGSKMSFDSSWQFFPPLSLGASMPSSPGKFPFNVWCRSGKTWQQLNAVLFPGCQSEKPSLTSVLSKKQRRLKRWCACGK